MILQTTNKILRFNNYMLQRISDFLVAPLRNHCMYGLDVVSLVFIPQNFESTLVVLK